MTISFIGMQLDTHFPFSGLILGLHITNERRRYKVTRLSLAGCKPKSALHTVYELLIQML